MPGITDVIAMSHAKMPLPMLILKQTLLATLCIWRRFLDDQGKLRFGVPEEDYLGPMDQVCSNCGALHFRDERERSGKSTYSECCMSGQIDPDLFNLTPYPPRMQQLFDDQDF